MHDYFIGLSALCSVIFATVSVTCRHRVVQRLQTKLRLGSREKSFGLSMLKELTF